MAEKLDRAALAIGSLSCGLLLCSLLVACAEIRTTEEKLSHLAVECVYTRLGEICEKEDGDEKLHALQAR